MYTYVYLTHTSCACGSSSTEDATYSTLCLYGEYLYLICLFFTLVYCIFDFFVVYLRSK